MDQFVQIGLGLTFLGFALWLAIALPAQMAAKRYRSRVVWVAVSLIASPLVAIGLLALIGDHRTNNPAYGT